MNSEQLLSKGELYRNRPFGAVYGFFCDKKIVQQIVENK